MTSRAAEQQGLVFTGHYERFWDKEKIKNIAATIRKLYKCRVVMVTEEGGYSLYADDKYQAYEHARDMLGRLNRAPATRARIEEKYQNELIEHAKSVKYAEDQLTEIRAKYPELSDVTDIPEVYTYMKEHNLAF